MFAGGALRQLGGQASHRSRVVAADVGAGERCRQTIDHGCDDPPVLERDAGAAIRQGVERVRALARATRFGSRVALDPLPDGGTRITFEYRWIVAPMIDRLTAPLARAYIRRNNTTAMRRLAALLSERDTSNRG